MKYGYFLKNCPLKQEGVKPEDWVRYSSQIHSSFMSENIIIIVEYTIAVLTKTKKCFSSKQIHLIYCALYVCFI